MSNAERIYVFISAEDWERVQQQGEYGPPSLAKEGFIHASPRGQLDRVANKFYRHVADVRLLHIEPARVRSEIRWENATGGLYPHIYGPLNADAVVRVTPVERAADGTLTPEVGLDDPA